MCNKSNFLEGSITKFNGGCVDVTYLDLSKAIDMVQQKLND